MNTYIKTYIFTPIFVIPVVIAVLASFSLPAFSEQKDGPDWVGDEIESACIASLDVCDFSCGSDPDCKTKCMFIYVKCTASIARQKNRNGTTGIGKSPKSKLSN